MTTQIIFIIAFSIVGLGAIYYQASRIINSDSLELRKSRTETQITMFLLFVVVLAQILESGS